MPGRLLVLFERRQQPGERSLQEDRRSNSAERNWAPYQSKSPQDLGRSSQLGNSIPQRAIINQGTNPPKKAKENREAEAQSSVNQNPRGKRRTKEERERGMKEHPQQ